MRAYLNGTIPDKVKIVSSVPENFSWTWDNYTVSENYQKTGPTLKAYQAWVCDASESRHLKTALHHAAQLAARLTPEGHEKAAQGTLKPPDILTLENKAFSGVRVVGVQSYASKVSYYVSFLEDKFCFEIESDALMDALTIGGVEGTGHLKGEFVFVRVAGRMKLVRLGSAYHKACVDADARTKTASIDKFELVPGKVYQTKTGNKALFLGFVSTYNLTFDMSKEQKKLTDAADGYSPRLLDIPPDWDKGISVNNIFWKMATLWMDVHHPEQHQLEESVKRLYDSTNYDVGYVALRKTHSFIEEMPNSPCVDVDIQAVFESCRKAASVSIANNKNALTRSIKAVEEDIRHFKENKGNRPTYTRIFSKDIPYASDLHKNLSYDARLKIITDFNRDHMEELGAMTKFFLEVNCEEKMLYDAPKANMIVYGMPPVLNPELQKIMTKYNGSSL